MVLQPLLRKPKHPLLCGPSHKVSWIVETKWKSRGKEENLDDNKSN